MQVLELANQPTSVKDIHVACEELLGRRVLYGSVKDWLSDNCRAGRVARVTQGHYQLKQERDARSASARRSENRRTALNSSSESADRAKPGDSEEWRVLHVDDETP